MRRPLFAAVDPHIQALVHDLRNPVAAITMNLDFLRGTLGGDDDQRAALIESRLACRTMERMLIELQALSAWQKEAPVPRREAVRLSDVLDVAVERCSDELCQGGVVVARAMPAELMASIDRPLIAGLFEHLIAEAGARTPRGGTLRIEAAARDAAAAVAIEHEGEPLDTEALERLFDAEAAVRITYRRLCLAYCRAVVEAHGGWVRATPARAGRGVRFEMELPGDEVAAAP